MEQSDKNRYRKILKENLSEVQQYLKSSEDAAAAVEPDKSLGSPLSNGSHSGSAIGYGNEKTEEASTFGNQIRSFED